MDNHPIPQDVTNFQFRLIGDMTLKQFGYVASCVIVGWIMLASPLFFLFKLIAAGFVVLIGVVLAFVPIDGRPSDVMLLRFMEALFSPTQFTYKKNARKENKDQEILPATRALNNIPGQNIEEQTVKKVQIESFIPAATEAVKSIQNLHPTAQETVTSPTVAQKKSSPVISEITQQEVTLQKEVNTLSDELTQATASGAHEKVTNLEKELEDVLKQKQDLEKQLIELQKTLSAKKQHVFAPGTAQIPQSTNHVKQIPKQLGTSVGVPLVPDVPNLITGVIKDSRNNVLNNILIEVKDKDNNPVRAFKTNQLGQFAAATPLISGTYTISFEDPAGKHNFDSVEITANGAVILPLEIVSVDAREKLRQELFGVPA